MRFLTPALLVFTVGPFYILGAVKLHVDGHWANLVIPAVLIAWLPLRFSVGSLLFPLFCMAIPLYGLVVAAVVPEIVAIFLTNAALRGFYVACRFVFLRARARKAALRMGQHHA